MTHPSSRSPRRRRARHRLAPLLVLTAAFLLAGCGEAGAPLPTTLEGAWLGEGAFYTQRGDMDVKAQLELLSDGSYRYAIIEPGIMALMGTEKGRWSREAQTLTLAAGGAEPEAPGGVFQNLRSRSPAAARPDKTLAIAPNLADLRFDDGKMKLTFRPNAEATAKLQVAGEVDG